MTTGDKFIALCHSNMRATTLRHFCRSRSIATNELSPTANGREPLRAKYARNPAVLRFGLYGRCFFIRALLSLEQFRVSISRRDYFDRLINLQTAKFAGGIVLISRALQIVVAQPTRDKAL